MPLTEEAKDRGSELLNILAKGGIYLHADTVARIARSHGLNLTDRQVLSIVSRDPRFERISPGVYFLRGLRPGRHYSSEEIEALDNYLSADTTGH